MPVMKSFLTLMNCMNFLGRRTRNVQHCIDNFRVNFGSWSSGNFSYHKRSLARTRTDGVRVTRRFVTMSSKKHLLVACDFDHTVVDENTDTYVLKLSPDELPDEITGLYRDSGWMEYMGEIFKYLHGLGRSKEDILDCMDEIQLTEGMRDLLTLTKPDVTIDFIIISDSNSVFIKHILDRTNLSASICEVFTNPASFDPNGCLTVRGYHYQDWCSLSSENLCKGHILDNFLKEKQKSSVEYSNILYIGDGFNDLCPGLTLREEDFLMPRIGFTLDKKIQKMCKTDKPVKRSCIKASVVPWSTGYDIIKQIDNITK